MNPLEHGVAQPVLDLSERLRGHESLFGGDNPDDLPFGLECQHVFQIEQVVPFAGSADDFARASRDRSGSLRHFDERLGDPRLVAA